MRFLMMLCILVPALGVAAGSSTKEEYERVRTMEIHHIDLSTIKDGTYDGEFSYAKGRAIVKVRVRVKAHAIDSVILVQGGMNRHGRKADCLVDSMKVHQTPAVDAITGATSTSKALCKAVEKALLKGKEASASTTKSADSDADSL